MESLYKGMYLCGDFGNNAFSLDKRKNKTIFIPEIIRLPYNAKDITDNLLESDKVAFCEFDEEISTEQSVLGIKNFIFSENKDKKMYIFDNHNHCFYFVAGNVIRDVKTSEDENVLERFLGGQCHHKKKVMVHFDQHKDMRVPSVSLAESVRIISGDKEKFDINYMSDFEILYAYTNYFLNVGNFIVPLLENGFIKEVVIVDSTYSMEILSAKIDFYDDVILDIDLDFFSKDMDYIDEDDKVELIRRCYEKSSLITVCTSPYFIEFDRARDKIEKILKLCLG